MVNLDLKLNSSSAAFADGNGPAEIARILRLLALKIEGGSEGTFSLRDINGNKCGEVFLDVWPDDEEASA